jgi:endonuclease/exonuclease/phosphatase family metal-dependent hydrolase
LQEVPPLERGGEAFLQRVCAVTGLQAISGAELRARCAHYGNALLTRFEVRRRSTLYLGVDAREPRGAIHAMLDCGTLPMQVIATHLGLSPAERRQQIKRILPLVTQRTEPVALLGDINEWFVWGRPLRWLHAQFGQPPAPRSFPSFMPVVRLDRVWVSRPSVVMSVRAHVSALAKSASDHLPVKARVELRQADCPERSSAAGQDENSLAVSAAGMARRSSARCG